MSLPPTKDNKIVKRDKVSEILNAKKEDFTVKYILRDLGLGKFPNRDKIYELNDKVILKKGDYKGINKKTETTLGKLLINKIIFDPVGYDYQNDTFTEKKIQYHLNYIGAKVLNKELDMKEYKSLLNRFEDFSLRMSSFVNPSLSVDMMNVDPSIKKLRDKLIKDNKEAIENGDTEIVSEIEEKLIEKVKEVYKDNPQMQHYLSGAGPSLGNSFKKSSLMVGAIPANLNSTKFHVTTSNYVDGLKKSDIHKVSSSMILGGYFRA
jgi:ribosomal protein L36